MKKLILTALSLFMVFGAFMNVSAEVVKEGWNEGAETKNGTIVVKAGNEAFSKGNFVDATIDETAKTYEIFVELKGYEHGELFNLSLGFNGEDGERTSEHVVVTQKTEEGYVLTAGVSAGNKIVITEPGVYKYVWTVAKKDGEVSSVFSVEGVDGELPYTQVDGTAGTEGTLQNATSIRYLWAFGRFVDGAYKLDRDLVMYVADFNPSIEFIGLAENYQVGDVVEFEVATSISEELEGSKMVKGVSALTGDDCVELEYFEVATGEWLPLQGNSFGPNTGFPIMNVASKFRATFVKAGTADYKVDIVDAATGEVYATTEKHVNVVEKSQPETKPTTPTISCAGSKDKNCDGVITCDEEKGTGWTWNNAKKVCEYTGNSGYQVVNTAVK